MNYYSDDPVRDAERYADRQEEQLSHLPICEVCQEPIQDEMAFNFGNEWVHRECIEGYFIDEYKSVPNDWY